MKTLHQTNNGEWKKEFNPKPKAKWAKSCVDKTDYVPDIAKQFNLAVGANYHATYDTDIDPELKSDLSSFRNLNDITEIESAKQHFKIKMEYDSEKAEKEILQKATKNKLIQSLTETNQNSESKTE